MALGHALRQLGDELIALESVMVADPQFDLVLGNGQLGNPVSLMGCPHGELLVRVLRKDALKNTSTECHHFRHVCCTARGDRSEPLRKAGSVLEYGRLDLYRNVYRVWVTPESSTF